MRVEFSVQSREDLAAITYFIASDNPERAKTFVRELRDACQRLDKQPERFAIVKTTDQGQVHRMPYRSYAVFYLVEETSLLILRIVHGAIVRDEFIKEL